MLVIPTPRPLEKTDTMERVMVQQYLGYQIVVMSIECEGAEVQVRHPS
jgi:hypothetical protein